MRVIAGSARGRSLQAPQKTTTRPTGDKVKGAIFSMLEAEAFRRGFVPSDSADGTDRFAAAVCWPRVLELYGGSGALSIEALSRGASSADIVEADRDARAIIHANLTRTGLAERARVVARRADLVLDELPGPYDLVLLDPPYGELGVEVLVARMANPAIAASGAAMIWEHARTNQPPDRIENAAAGRSWRRDRTNVHGITAISLYTVVEDGR